MMNDKPEVLEPGAAGRLAVLVGEVRALRAAADRLGGEAGVLGDEVHHQGARLDRLEAIISTLAEGIAEIHGMLVTPAVELPPLPRETSPSSSIHGGLEQRSEPVATLAAIPATDDAAASDDSAEKKKKPKPAEKGSAGR